MSKPNMNPEWDLLLSAAQKNRTDRIRELVETDGVNPSHSNAVGQSALHIAALWGHVASVQLLVELGANVNAANNLTGATPLHMVAQSQKAGVEARLLIIDILLHAGAAADTPDKYGSLPVDGVQVSEQSGGDEATVKVQTQRFAAKLQPRRSDIHTAIADRNLPALEELLPNHGDASTTNNSNKKDNDNSICNVAYLGQSPLDLAIDELRAVLSAHDSKQDEADTLLSILKLLLANGADANGGTGKSVGSAAAAVDDVMGPPLHRVVSTLRECYKAAANDDQNVSESWAVAALSSTVEILMSAGAVVPPETSLLLHQAARFNEVPFARFLINGCLHVDPNTKGRQGMTPLQFSARSGRTEMLRLLLEHPGIDVNATDDRGNTALDAARVNQKQEAVTILTEYA